MEGYERRSDGLYCPHGAKVDAMAPCAACAVGPEVALEDEVTDTSENPQIALDAQWCRDRRDEIARRADEIVALGAEYKEQREDDGLHGRMGVQKVALCYNTAAKLYDTALKYHRCAVEERKEKDDKDHDKWLVRKNRELQQRGVSH